MCCSLKLSLIFFFFFSSRRRHTRLQGDWSSDVCSSDLEGLDDFHRCVELQREIWGEADLEVEPATMLDRKSTRLNSSHLVISYAVFCLKKKKIRPQQRRDCHVFALSRRYVTRRLRQAVH